MPSNIACCYSKFITPESQILPAWIGGSLLRVLLSYDLWSTSSRKQTRVRTVCKYSNRFKQFKHKTHKLKIASSSTGYHTEIIKTTEKTATNCIAGGTFGTSVARRPPDQTTTQCHLPASCTHACSAYERLDYHISWSRLRQHSHIRELGNQIAWQGVSPHSVDWAPVWF